MRLAKLLSTEPDVVTAAETPLANNELELMHAFWRACNYLSVGMIYFERFPNSLKLGFAAFVISMVLGVPLGMLSALKVNTWWDSLGKMLALLGLSMPGFFIGLVLVIVFGVELGSNGSISTCCCGWRSMAGALAGCGSRRRSS